MNYKTFPGSVETVQKYDEAIQVLMGPKQDLKTAVLLSSKQQPPNSLRSCIRWKE